MPGKHCAAIACAIGIGASCAGSARADFGFDDIEFWAGAGENRAALVIDWNDGKSSESIAWGFRWDGTATGIDMLEAVVRADDRLFGAIGSFVWGSAAIGLGYDTDGDGFATSPGIAFDADGYALVGQRDGTLPTDSDDHYVEGWNTGYWSYYVAPDSPYGVSAWAYANDGLSGWVLSDGEWDGVSFAPGFDGPAPGEPVAAQVPGPAGALGLVIGAFVSQRRRLR